MNVKEFRINIHTATDAREDLLGPSVAMTIPRLDGKRITRPQSSTAVVILFQIVKSSVLNATKKRGHTAEVDEHGQTSAPAQPLFI